MAEQISMNFKIDPSNNIHFVHFLLENFWRDIIDYKFVEWNWSHLESTLGDVTQIILGEEGAEGRWGGLRFSSFDWVLVM
jgi:hypothetical protein